MSNHTSLYIKEKKWIIVKSLCVFEERHTAFGFVRPNRSELFNVRFVESN